MNTGNPAYEEATNEFRQVKTPIFVPHFPGSSIKKITGYDVTIQRKWIVYDGPSDASDGMIVFSTVAGQLERVARDEWRDIQTVTDPKAP